MAKKFISFDHAAKVAKLVSDALETSNARFDKKEKPSNNIFSGFLRLFGFDAKKLGAIAVNALIVVAQLVIIFSNITSIQISDKKVQKK